MPLLEVILMAATASALHEGVQIEPFGAWKQAYWVSNASTKLAFVPEAGRILYFGPVSGPNLLWVNSELDGFAPPLGGPKDWTNIGGDKIWISGRGRHGWPPDLSLDPGWWTVESVGPRSIRVTSKPSVLTGIVIERTISLDPEGSRVRFRNRLTNTGAKQITHAAWQVTQVDDPDRALMPFIVQPGFPNGYSIIDNAPPAGAVTVEAGFVVTRRLRNSAWKIGAGPRTGWVGSEKAGLRLVLSSKIDPTREFPEMGEGFQLYGNGDPLKYMELEAHSPLTKMEPGDTFVFETQWSLKPTP